PPDSIPVASQPRPVGCGTGKLSSQWTTLRFRRGVQMPTFDVEVISDPIKLLASGAYDFNSPLCKASPHYDTQIIKPALLFADRVNLVSSRSTLHHFVGIEAAKFTKDPSEQIKA